MLERWVQRLTFQPYWINRIHTVLDVWVDGLLGIMLSLDSCVDAQVNGLLEIMTWFFLARQLRRYGLQGGEVLSLLLDHKNIR